MLQTVRSVRINLVVALLALLGGQIGIFLVGWLENESSLDSAFILVIGLFGLFVFATCMLFVCDAFTETEADYRHHASLTLLITISTFFGTLASGYLVHVDGALYYALPAALYTAFSWLVVHTSQLVMDEFRDAEEEPLSKQSA